MVRVAPEKIDIEETMNGLSLLCQVVSTAMEVEAS
jgi:hypothetical protein